MTTARTATVAGGDVSTRESIRNWALVALVLYLISGLAFAGFSTAGGIWFSISDAVGLFLAFSLMVLVIRFDELFRPVVGSTSRIARWIGVVAMSLGMAGSVVLLSSQAGHEFVPGEGGLGMQFVGWGLLGIWFVMIGRMATQTESFNPRWVWAAYVAGWGSIIAMVATIPLGPDSPVVAAGFTVTFVAIMLWVVWTRRQLAR